MEDYISNIKKVLQLLLLATFISYLHVVLTGTYNGDFNDVLSTLTPIWLFLLFVVTLIPYVLLYRLCKCFKINNLVEKSVLNVPVFALFTYLIIFIHIFLLILNIGVMGGDGDASLQYISTIVNIFNPYLFSFLLVYYIRSRKIVIITILLLALYTLLKQSLFGFLYIVCFLILLRGDYLWNRCRKYVLFFLFVIFSLPVIISILYQIRDSMRANEKVSFRSENDISVITDRLMGRLSPYSNLCNIFENHTVWVLYTKSMSDYFYPYTILDRFGIHYNTIEAPERFMFYIYANYNTDSNVTFMLGTMGKLYLALLKSLKCFILTFSFIVLLVIFSFRLAKNIPVPFNMELCYLTLIFPIMSGVSYELFFAFLQIFTLSVFFRLIKMFKRI